MTATTADVTEVYDPGAETAEVERALTNAKQLASARLSASAFETAAYDNLVAHLAAHFLTATYPLEVSHSVGDGDTEFERADAGDGLRETRFGRDAILLDHTGTLDAAGDDTASAETGVFETFGT